VIKLGMISNYQAGDLISLKQRGLDYAEFCINADENDFFSVLETIEKILKQEKLHVFSIGRWGIHKIDQYGIIKNELNINLKLIDACTKLGSPIFVTGCNYVESISYERNMEYALSYLKELSQYAKPKGVKIAVQNCRWNNFLVGPDTWDVILDQIPGIGIKYDPSHAIYDQKNYLKEINDYGQYIFHIHLKGSLFVDGMRVDDPPAGLDITNWKAIISILYFKGYQGGLSIEPHSKTWKGSLGEEGIRYTIDYFRPLIFKV